ncbi:MAG: hemolysin III family protein [Treponema sp.]|nr:hemolysin III family protein [Treponema sp.]
MKPMKHNETPDSRKIVLSRGEETANAALHGAGVLLGAAGLALLAAAAPAALPESAIFASAMILMFLASTLYHALVPSGVKELFRVFDHQAIYLFIAGTYTPYCLLALKGALGWAFFWFEWTLALAGIVLSALKCRFLKKAELAVFILMGWAILAGAVPLSRALSTRSMVLLFAGGAAYTAGTFWYRAGKPRAHAIWHLFVLAGAACHWFSVWFLCLTA